MNPPAVPLFDRLPEIYRVRDAEQSPPDQLRAYLAAVEEAFGALHDNIGQLYDDLFIDTCDDWVIPYLADLLGTTHLKGEPRTLRADVADTIALRRRKGTLGAIERLAVNLTGWACRARRAAREPRRGRSTSIISGPMPAASRRTATRRADRARSSPDAARRHACRSAIPAALALLGTPFDLSPTPPMSNPRPTTRVMSICRISRCSCGGWRITVCA